MSHIARIETAIKDISQLVKVLDELGMDYNFAPEGETLSVKGFSRSETITGCLLEIKTGSAYSIGIRGTEDGYEAVADWWAVETFTGQKREDILNRVMRQYAYRTVVDKARDMGFSLVSEEEDASENLRISLRRWSP
ncbi:MAG: DUF1257 domain-containing protein [Spirochaetaceae bacterium]|nr:DUF1257 domain-containing protein [Spirochaetaceae bacterium]